jgi:hypothetical protein
MTRALTLVVALALATAASASAQTPSPRPEPTPALSCTPDGADLDHPVPLNAPDAAVAGLVQSYRAPEVLGLRAALDAVAAGTADSESARTMQGVSPELLANRFVLLSDDTGLFGGYWLLIQFRGHPESIYRTWIYGHGSTSRNGPFSIRAWERAECSPRQQHWLDVRFGAIYRKMPGG